MGRSSMVAPQYDDGDWPLFRVRLPRTELSDAEFIAFLETLDGLHERGSKFALLLDVRAAPPLPPKRRQLVGEHSDAANARYPGLLVGTGLVMSSAVQRGIMTAINWLMRRPQVVRAFASPGEAEAWLRERLRESGARPLASGE